MAAGCVQENLDNTSTFIGRRPKAANLGVFRPLYVLNTNTEATSRTKLRN